MPRPTTTVVVTLPAVLGWKLLLSSTDAGVIDASVKVIDASGPVIDGDVKPSTASSSYRRRGVGLADGPLLHAGEERLHDADLDVGLEQAELHLAESSLEVLLGELGELGEPGEPVSGLAEALGMFG